MLDEPLYVGSDANPYWYGATVTPTSTGVAVPADGATITYSLADSTGSVADTGTLSYIAGSAGDYIGVIESAITADLVVGAYYTLTLTFSQSTYDDVRVTRHRATLRGKN